MEDSPVTFWFTSDMHLGSPQLTKQRGFRKDVTAHDDAIMSGLLGKIRQGDEVFIVGDVTSGGARSVEHAVELLAPLKNRVGYRRMHLIRGNHEANTARENALYCTVFSTLTPMLNFFADVDGFGPVEVDVCHYPPLQFVDACNRTRCHVRDGEAMAAPLPWFRWSRPLVKSAGAWTRVYLYGHTHAKTPFLGGDEGVAVNVGVDVWGLKPVSLEEILTVTKQKAPK